MRKLEIMVPERTTKITMIYSVSGTSGHQSHEFDLNFYDKWPEWKKIPIEELGVSTVAGNALLRAGVQFVGDLFCGDQLRRQELFHMRGLGVKKVDEIEAAAMELKVKYESEAI